VQWSTEAHTACIGALRGTQRALNVQASMQTALACECSTSCVKCANGTWRSRYAGNVSVLCNRETFLSVLFLHIRNSVRYGSRHGHYAHCIAIIIVLARSVGACEHTDCD